MRPPPELAQEVHLTFDEEECDLNYLMTANDSGEFTFNEIADALERYWTTPGADLRECLKAIHSRPMGAPDDNG